MITVLDDFIPTSLADEIAQLVSTRDFPWFYTESSSGVGKNYDINNKLIKESSQHIHIVFDEQGAVSNMYNYIKIMLYFLEDKTNLKVKDLFRVKINSLLTDRSAATQYNTPHIDHPDSDYMSMVYYINDSDGDTVIFDQHVQQGYNNLTIANRVFPKKGKCVIFPSNQFHSSSNPVVADRRLIINFTFRIA